MWFISTTVTPLYLLGITLTSCKRAVIMLTFCRKSCFLPREVRFPNGILKFGKTHFSLERVEQGLNFTVNADVWFYNDNFYKKR